MEVESSIKPTVEYVSATPLASEKTDETLYTPVGNKEEFRRALFDPPATPSNAQTPSVPSTPSSVSHSNANFAIAPREPIKVFLRVRPLTNEEVVKKEQTVITKTSETTVTVKAPKESFQFRVNGGETESKFSFNEVLDVDSTQSQVFKRTALPLVEQFMKGSNALLCAYGITNAGKTYTINGGTSKQEHGIFPRILEVIFHSISQQNSAHALHKLINKNVSEPNDFEVSSLSEGDNDAIPRVELDRSSKYTVFFSCCEIYNEKCYDLFDDANSNTTERKHLPLKEDKHGNVYVKDAKNLAVPTLQSAKELIAKMNQNRQAAQTQLNRDSSRSHLIITLKLVKMSNNNSLALSASKNQNDQISIRNQTKISKFAIVDLAGSERTNRTGTFGARLKEASNINCSIMTFGRCIETLRYNQSVVASSSIANSVINSTLNSKVKVVPFRDSKLTRLISEYFVGASRAVLIVNASPSSSDYDETLSVLKFSAVAKEVTTSSKIDNTKPISFNLPSKFTSQSSSTSLAAVSAVVSNASAVASMKEADNLVIEDLDDLEGQEMDKEAIRMEIEEEVRAEVANEVTKQISDMEALLKFQLEQQIQLVEEKYEKKIDVIQKLHDNELENAKAKISYLSSTKENLSLQISNLQKEISSLQTQNSNLQETIGKQSHDLLKEVSYWQQKGQEISKDYSESKTLCETLQKEVDLLKSKLVEAEKLNSNSKLNGKSKITPSKKDLKKIKDFFLDVVTGKQHETNTPTTATNVERETDTEQQVESIITTDNSKNEVSRRIRSSSQDIIIDALTVPSVNSSNPSNMNSTPSSNGNQTSQALPDSLLEQISSSKNQQDAIMKETDSEQFEELVLDSDRPVKKRKKPAEKPAIKETEDSPLQKKEKLNWKKGKKIAKSIISHSKDKENDASLSNASDAEMNSPNSSKLRSKKSNHTKNSDLHSIVDPQLIIDELPIPLSPPSKKQADPPRLRKKKLFNADAVSESSMLEEQEDISVKPSKKTNGPSTPITRRLRGAKKDSKR